MNNRIHALDTFRGIAILGMVLSGSIAYGDVLPAWMYHAQVPPPDHIFHPEIAGITWVDLVFPFFLFSMGAAIPLSFNRKLQLESSATVVRSIFKRAVTLLFFAVFIKHIESYTFSNPSTIKDLIGILSFLLLHVVLATWPYSINKNLHLAIKLSAFIGCLLLLFFLPYTNGAGFSIEKNDIIIVVLANMALFGSFLWWCTRHNRLYLLLVLPFIMGIFLSSATPSSWQSAVFNFSPIAPLYKFYYLKYLFIIVPGLITGEQLLKYSKPEMMYPSSQKWALALFILTIVLVIGNLYFLFTRQLVANLIFSIALCTSILQISQKFKVLLHRSIFFYFTQTGSYFLLLGLVFEAYQGGIRKDISTYSYYFVSAGLAFFLLSSLLSLESCSMYTSFMHFLARTGQNPMLAYVAGALLITPLLHLLSLDSFLALLNANAYAGFLKGVLFTTLVSLVTIAFVKLKFFWKT